jgi:hypothetical protein
MMMQLFSNKAVTLRLYRLAAFWAGLGALSVASGTAAARPQDQNQGPAPSSVPSAPAGGATQPAQPIPAVRSPLASLTDNDQEDADQQAPATPDTHALAGAEYLTLGGPAYKHSYWQPQVDVSVTALSNPVIGGSGGGWSTYTSLSGGINLTQISGNSTLTLSYQGGAAFSNGGGSNSVIQQMAVTDALAFRRWRVALIDQVGYLPQASLGFAGLGITAPTIGSSLGIQTGFEPDQSVLTAAGQRISNASIIEADYLISRRATLTFVGSGSELYFLDNDLNNTTEGIAQVGYNYQLTRKDTIAILYSFDAIRYNNIDQSIDTHAAEFAYSRRQTGKLAFQISAGPEFAISTLPLTTSAASTTSTPTKSTQFLWTASSAVTYQLKRRTTLQATFDHGVTGGSGVLAGAVADAAMGTLSHQMSRATTLAFSGGYSRNSGLALTPGSAELVASNQTYDYWFGGANWTHRIGGSINLMLGYQLQYQNSNAAFCVTTPCTSSFTTHDIFLDLQFRPRLIPF